MNNRTQIEDWIVDKVCVLCMCVKDSLTLTSHLSTFTPSHPHRLSADAMMMSHLFFPMTLDGGKILNRYLRMAEWQNGIFPYKNSEMFANVDS